MRWEIIQGRQILNGRRAGLKIRYREVCRFESDLGHHPASPCGAPQDRALEVAAKRDALRSLGEGGLPRHHALLLASKFVPDQRYIGEQKRPPKSTITAKANSAMLTP